ncbi:MAG: polysaccharide biosynthesis protein [Rhodobacteraceae bacterium]|nr:polysaccharide biosynthesis protein [Paracoccaceae bacterium]
MQTDLIGGLLRLTRVQKRLIQIATDAVLVTICFIGAMWLRLEHVDFAANPDVWLAFLPVLPVAILAFWHIGLYRSILRFITAQAFIAIGAGVLAASAVLFLASQLLAAPIPRSVPGIFAILLFGAIGGVRFLMRSLIREPGADKRQPVIIYGAGEAGRQLQSALLHGREYRAVAFVDDDPALQGSLIGGRCVHAPSALPKLIEDHPKAPVLLALPSVSRSRRREIVAGLEQLGAEIRTIPGMADIVSGRASFSDLRRVTPEELLGRDPIPPSLDLMGQNITGKVVLVSGAGGSIGSELCRQIIHHDPAALILLEVSEFALYSIALELRETIASQKRSLRLEPVLGSVQNPGRVRAILRSFGVQTVYHAAAYKHVAVVEENVVEGIRNNVFGTRVMADAAAELGVENFILISTDKAVRPTNFMGASKRIAELVCQARAQDPGPTTFSMVRFGNVLGSSGSVIPRFRAQIEQGGPVTVTHPEITRYFMTIPEAAQLVIQAGAMAKGGDVFVLDMGAPVKILDLAHSMIRLHGLKPYMMDKTDSQDKARGDIGIQIIGLNKGDKLYEELLVGNDPTGTNHPRIMTATELSLKSGELARILDRLQGACSAFDLPSIRDTFLDAPLDYQPNDNELHDLIWNAARRRATTPVPILRAVDTAS